MAHDRDRIRKLVEQVMGDLGESLPGPPPDSSTLPRSPLPRAPLPRSPLPRAQSAPSDAPSPAPLNPSQRMLQPGAARRVAIGSDHGGFELKGWLKELLQELGYTPVDVGTHSKASCDYPDFAIAVGRAIQSGQCRFGIMIDGAGIGSAMALNKMSGIRAATVHSETTAVNSKEHNDANVLVLGSAQIHSGHARRITRIWLATDHAGGRHALRVDKINALDTARGGGA